MRAEPAALGDSLLAHFGLPPAEIERLSLARMERMAGQYLPRDPGLRHVARRVLYAAGDPDLAPSLRLHPDLVTAGVAALRAGRPVVVDVSMVAAGLGGNAPTALLELLDLIDAGCAPPAAIVGMPVGLVAAAESKEELAQRTTPYATVLGTRGGSPLAAAAVNALLQLAVENVDG